MQIQLSTTINKKLTIEILTHFFRSREIYIKKEELSFIELQILRENMPEMKKKRVARLASVTSAPKLPCAFCSKLVLGNHFAVGCESWQHMNYNSGE